MVEISGVTVSAPDARGFVSEHDARECMGAESANLVAGEDGPELLLTGLELWSDDLLWAWLDALEGEEDAAKASLVALNDDGDETARLVFDLAAMAMLVETPEHGLVLVDTPEEVEWLAVKVWPDAGGGAVYHENYLGRNVQTK